MSDSLPARFPRVPLASAVSAQDRAEAVDFINRVNWPFETWEVDAMVEAFLPDGVAYHFHGVIRGREAMRRFFDRDDPDLVPGVGRHATNPIVDRDGDGVSVRYHNLLVRYAMPEHAGELAAGGVRESDGDLPGLWIYSPMLDRLRRTPDGWRIAERHVGGSMTNPHLERGSRDREAMTSFLPHPGSER
ncbi:nuclear transport factor 2 family protein [Acetobacteraceae bacterium KSS8]|uniref:Nuclear transport factor 2 family protein n=1 Tax=Endosaccharibacter trunci TaxID=2812733 RepID=A0ABT1WCW9_9PROT|nr:nuclear transport factor 2 family protein [Acetobacteraceae bacterium KSS8]